MLGLGRTVKHGLAGWMVAKDLAAVERRALTTFGDLADVPP